LQLQKGNYSFIKSVTSSITCTLKEHIENIISDIDKKANPYTFLTSHFFLGEVYFYLKEKERAIKEYEESYDAAINFDEELALSIKEVLEKVRAL